jgi:thiamine kinase-like enzyme
VRQAEYAAHRAAAGLGLAPQVVDFLEPEGYLVTRFVVGKPIPPEEMGRPENLRRVAQAMRRYHSLPAIPWAFSPFRTVDHYTATARELHVEFPAAFERWQAALARIEVSLGRDPFLPRLCHNDLLNANFLDDGTLRILDWEYAGMGDVTFDLANFAVHHDLGGDQEHLLLQEYYDGLPTPARMARLHLMKIASDFREAMWGIVQLGISQLDFDFRGYADKHFGRMARQMDSPSFHQWLEEVR